MFKLSAEPIDADALRARCAEPRGGALVTFEGRVRDRNQGRETLRLCYEAHPEMARREGERVLEEARERFDIIEVHCVHRTGVLEVGETAVWVGVVAAHRRAALEGCGYIIDEIKKRLPVWKKEYYKDGTSTWVNAAAGTRQEHGLT